ncbi:MAG: hypothetical protein LBP32_03830 [Spirochaetaceae bacterium]|jgi:hypothetical protein|nr:hypothetical protein [Spirochaetaceae bacterium]
MSLVCFLWMPLFYLFWRSVSPERGGSGEVWALLLGSIVALIQFFLGALVNPGGFGFSRWISACVDVVGLPAVLPFLVCALGAALRLFSPAGDLTGFALLWLIPGAAIRAVSWSAHKDPSLLVLVPLLWTSLAVGIPFFIRILRESYGGIIIFAVTGVVVLPFLAASVYWAFFSQRSLLGFCLFFIALIPLGASVILSLFRTAV